jgi:hypothetical protein
MKFITLLLPAAAFFTTAPAQKITAVKMADVVQRMNHI